MVCCCDDPERIVPVGGWSVHCYLASKCIFWTHLPVTNKVLGLLPLISVGENKVSWILSSSSVASCYKCLNVVYIIHFSLLSQVFGWGICNLYPNSEQIILVSAEMWFFIGDHCQSDRFFLLSMFCLSLHISTSSRFLYIQGNR